MSSKDTKEIADLLRRENVDILGFAQITSEIPSVSEDFSPKKLLKEARSVVIFAIPIPKGVLYSDSHDKLLFWRYCSIMYRTLDSLANSLCSLLEKEGYISTPIYSCFPWKIVNREFWGLLPLVYWAEQAGLGKLTRCGLLINPKYGTRILLGGVLTAKSFKKSERIHEDICLKDCFKCVEACPVKAIDQTGKVNHDLCMRTANKNPILAHLIKDSELRKSIDFETIINTVGVEDNSSYACMECLKVCPLNR